ncbi:hypothetical protein M514_09592 [Trichuris suis]|uniref:Uncharacterized protein n=1 Tax=Trichuris suis TaxID=68888 RepID=A0A085N420_9BILA|nr:hypothetical protein M513_09592 [Trichuris suis]KFD64216.1 hypothetical protein M514_09592 [Trichuris suis]
MCGMLMLLQSIELPKTFAVLSAESLNKGKEGTLLKESPHLCTCLPYISVVNMPRKHVNIMLKQRKYRTAAQHH